MDEQTPVNSISVSTLTPSSKRIEIIDSLRGLAMLGIMIVNFPSVNSYATFETSSYGGVLTTWDKIFEMIGMQFFNGKFYPIFAILFGLGSYIFFQNAQKKGSNGKWMLFRRLLFLFSFGLLHILFIWWGDILLVYSILGMILILFMDLQPKTIFKLVLSFLLIIPLMRVGLELASTMNIFDMKSPLYSGLGYLYTGEDLQRIYGSGDFFLIMKQRIIDYIYDFTFILENKVSFGTILGDAVYYSELFGCFLLGVFVAKSEWHKKIDLLLPKIIKLWWPFLILSISSLIVINISPLLNNLFALLQGEIFAIFYILSFIILLNRFKQSFVFDLFRAVGKMSLTVYIAHTLFASLLLYGYGFGLFYHIGPFALFFVSLCYYFLMAVICQLWQRKFEFGRLVALWRKLTYGKLLLWVS